MRKQTEERAAPNPARRAFLRGAHLTREGREHLAARTERRGPPPPWLHDVIAAGRCHDCERFCARACQSHIIAFHAADHVKKGQPYLDFTHNACTHCGACADACPDYHDAVLGHPRIGIAQIDAARCLAWQRITCISCRDRCAEVALRLDPQLRPRVDVERCSGCGACAAVCPARAIRILP